MTILNRYKGCLLGLACGDAVGTAVEFKPPFTFDPVTDMVGGGPFKLEAGQWTDDTSLALCLAESLIECGYDPVDQMTRYVKWMQEGYMSSSGICFDIGITTRNALNDFIDLGDPYSGETSPNAAGNGSLMRLAPVPMFKATTCEEPDNVTEGTIQNVIKYSGDSSRTTHGATTCIDACRFYGCLIALALGGATKEEILSVDVVEKYFSDDPLCPEIHEVAMGSYKERQPSVIKGSGYVVKSLEAALWAFMNPDNNFKAAILDAVNLGDDADTTAAICGQLAGAYYGIDGIPEEWLEKLTMKDEIENMAERLLTG